MQSESMSEPSRNGAAHVGLGIANTVGGALAFQAFHDSLGGTVKRTAALDGFLGHAVQAFVVGEPQGDVPGGV